MMLLLMLMLMVKPSLIFNDVDYYDGKDFKNDDNNKDDDDDDE